MPMSRRC